MRSLSVALFSLLTLSASGGLADARAIAQEDRIAELERQVQVLAGELANVRTQVAVPEDESLKSAYGMGPAASKIYGIERGLSLGGYGEAQYVHFVSDAGSDDLDRADALRTVLYVGYKFSESIAFNSELEFEHASSSDVGNGAGEGSISVEFAALDFFWKPELNFRAGLLLVPMGFINEVHEPPFFYGVSRPEVERRILPSTWRENGAGVFGQLGESFEYRAYLVNGFNGARLSDAGLRNARQKGNRALAEDFGFVGRLDWRPEALPGLSLGGSYYIGDVDQDTGGIPDARLQIGEIHLQYEDGPWRTRFLAAATRLSDAADLSAFLASPSDRPIADKTFGAYGEVGVDLWSMILGNEDKSFEPFVRVEYVDTQYDVPKGWSANRNRAYWVYTPGFNFYPHPNVVLKLEYRNLNARGGTRPDEIALGMGFAF